MHSSNTVNIVTGGSYIPVAIAAVAHTRKQYWCKHNTIKWEIFISLKKYLVPCNRKFSRDLSFVNPTLVVFRGIYFRESTIAQLIKISLYIVLFKILILINKHEYEYKVKKTKEGSCSRVIYFVLLIFLDRTHNLRVRKCTGILPMQSCFEINRRRRLLARVNTQSQAQFHRTPFTECHPRSPVRIMLFRRVD